MPVEYGPNGYADFNPPEGFRWHARPEHYSQDDIQPGYLRMAPVARRNRSSWAAAVRRLIEWATELDIFVQFYDSRSLELGGSGWTDFQVHPSLPRRTDRNQSWGINDVSLPTPCNCGADVQPWQSSCSACGAQMSCYQCQAYHWGNKMMRLGDGRIGCNRCVRQCQWIIADTGLRCESAAGSRLVYCIEHTDPANTHTCAGCNEAFDRHIIPRVVVAGRDYDGTCARGLCHTCAAVAPNGGRHPHIDQRERPQCLDCYNRMQRFFVAAPASGAAMTAQETVIEALPNRPVRLTSVELEFCRGSRGTASGYMPGNDLATRLVAAELSPYNQQMRYHCGMHEFPSHVENDSSVDGGELILNRLRLDQPEDAGHFQSVLGLTQTMLGEQRLAFNARCGVHIHVDMHGYGILDARNLVTMYNYLEDVIYRFASAGYQDHRALINGSDYARPLLKGEWPTAKEFGVAYLQQANHRDSLNMEHFFKAWNNCQCGAIRFGTASECTCIRPKNTAEWRVFNGTNDPRILWAWIVFVQSLTAWCQNRELVVSEFEPLAFEPGINFMAEKLGDSHHNLVDAWRSRLDWLFRNLVFTDRERGHILDVMATTPLKHIGQKELLRLRTVEAVPDERTLEVPFIAARRPQNAYERNLETYNNRFDDDGYCALCSEYEDNCECEAPLVPTPRRTPRLSEWLQPPPRRRRRTNSG